MAGRHPTDMACAAPQELRLVESFIPPSLHLAVAGGSAPDGDMALLWLDIVGSTRIAGRLVESGPAGAEELASLLNRHFGQLLDLLVGHGGEPLMFAGDALLAGWRFDAAGPREAVMRASACAQAVLAAPAIMLDSGEPLRLHLAVAAGARHTTTIGAGQDALYVTAGAGLADLQATTRTRAPGDILLSPAARTALGEAAEAERAGPAAFRLTELRDAPDPRPLAIPHLSPQELERLQAPVPLPIASRLERRLMDWAVELRRVSVIFVGIPDLDQSSIGSLQDAAAIIGPVVRRHDGYVHQFRIDESGANLLIYFGIPPIAHSDDPARAVRCAIDLRDALRAGGQRGSFGVTTGRVVCGLIGNDTFRAFAIFGDPVYLASRLKAAGPGAIQCDEPTVRAARASLDFLPAGQNEVGGLAGTVEVWTPKRRTQADPPIPMHGRDAELSVLLAAVRRARSAPAGDPASDLSGMLLIEADSGMGKSRLIAELQLQAAAEDVTVLAGQADRIERRVPFRVWRGVLAGLLGLDPADPVAAQRQAVLTALGTALAPRAALLNAILQLDLPESPETLALAPQRRIPLLQDLLLILLRRAAASSTVMVTIDDAHWADNESWALAETAARQVPGLCLVIGLQPLDNDAWPRTLAAAGATRLHLAELSAGEQDALALARLGAERIAPDLAALLRARARGHPFFCLELTQALREEGLIEVVDGTCRIARHIDPAHLPLPDTVQAMTTRRIDQLDPDSQVTLKVASAAGLRFPTRLVADVHPMAQPAPETISGHLALHHRIGLLEPDQIDDHDGYAFRHGILRDVTYGLMLYAQRRLLHRDIAGWYERVFAQDLARMNMLLAHHLEAAGEPERAATYLLRESERLFGAGLVRQSVEVGLHGARLLGADLPVEGAALSRAIGAELERIAALLGDRTPQDLVFLPRLTHAPAGQLIHLLLALAPFAFQVEPGLFVLLGCFCLRLTLEHGNGPDAADVYAMYSIVYGGMSGERLMAVQWSRLSLSMLHGPKGAGFSRCAFINIWFHSHWVAPLEHSMQLALEGAAAGLADSEIIYGCFNMSGYVVLLAAAAGRPLPQVMAEVRARMAQNGRRVLNSFYHLVLELQFAKALAGLTASPLTIGDAEYDESRDIASITESNLQNQVGYYFVTMARLHVHAGDFTGALTWASRAAPVLPFFKGQTAEFELVQYRGLASLAAAVAVAEADRQALVQDGLECTEQMRAWQVHNPALFSHKADLLDGLLQGVCGQATASSRLLMRAAETAADAGFLQDAGLAHEYHARLRHAAGDAEGAEASAAAARHFYAAWGATAKLALIEREFGILQRA